MSIKTTLIDKIRQFSQWLSEIPYRSLLHDIFAFIGGILHRALFTVLLPKRYRTLTKQQIYTIIFQSDTPAGKKFDIWLLVLIVANIIVIMLESMAGASHWFAALMRILGWGFTILFTFEFYLRIYCINKPSRYLFSLFGIIDILSIFPAYLSLFFPAVSTLSVLRLMRLLRIFRILKMQKFIDEGKFLFNAIKKSTDKILIFMMFVFIGAVILGAVIYAIEGDKNPQLSSIPKGIYWAVVTITTVGYGDISPVTPIGRFISILVMLLGYSIIAVPTGIVAGETYNELREQQANKNKRSKQSRKRGHPSEEHFDDPDERPDNMDDATDDSDDIAPSDQEGPNKPTKIWDDDPAVTPKPEDLM